MDEQQQQDYLERKCVEYADYPDRWVKWAVSWGEGELKDCDGPDEWQNKVLCEIRDYCLALKRGENPGPLQIAVASGHGVGKSVLVALIIDWFLSCRANPQVVVTANTETQLTTKTWRTVARWLSNLINADWFNWTATKLALKEQPESSYASAVPWSENNPDAFAGTHDKNVLVIFDEASKIHDIIWEKVDGAMSTRGAMWLCFGNPTRSTGRFYDCFHKYKKFWRTFQIDARTSKFADPKYIERYLEQFGEDSDRTRYQIYGQFPRASSRQLIPTEAVQKAMEHEMDPEAWQYLPRVLGCDIARFGDCNTVLIERQGRKVYPPEVLPKMDLMATADAIASKIRTGHYMTVFVDGSGLGAGVVDRLRQLGFQVVDVNGGNASLNPRYLNKRAEMWSEMAEFIIGLCELPKDQRLKDELTCVEYGHTDKGRLRLDRKEDILDTHGFSPDRADALALTFAYPVGEEDFEGEVDPKVYAD